MSNEVESFLDTIKQPEYTGKNRCIPCTAVNVVIAAILSVVIAIGFIEVAIVFFLLSLVIIYVRGYLIPGTPELTKRYLPDRIHRHFDQHPAEDEYLDPDEFKTVQKVKYQRENKVDPEEYLLEAGVIQFDFELDDIRLTEYFVERLDHHTDEIDPESIGEEDVAALFDADIEDVTDAERDYPAYTVDFRVRKWPSPTAFINDLAGERVMHEFTDDWLTVPVEQRAKMRETFRYLREFCPACGGEIMLTEETVDSCCGTWEVIAIKCSVCDEHFVELDPTQVGESPKGHGLTPD